MRRIVIGAWIALVAGAAVFAAAGSASGPSAVGTYKIEVDNAFGLVSGADFKVAGVKAGSIQSIGLDQKTLHALVTVNVTQPGFSSFRSDVFCQTRPQSLIGEYFIECDPGHANTVLPPGSTVPVTHTQTTIAPDLLADIMRVPYRERFTLIVNELGAAVAGNSSNLQAAIHRAVPALTETDNLLALLANDSHTLQDLTATADSVITALADNSLGVQHFVISADRTAQLTAQRAADLQATLQQLPSFLEQLRPALTQLGSATESNTPALQNLNASASQLNRFVADLTPFSRSTAPALKSLGQASVTGKAAVIAARPTVKDLNAFAKPTPELAQNLAIVLHDLDDRSRAVEKDPRSPTGQGFTGLEALLQYVYNQATAINYFGPFGHVLAVDAFVDPACSPFATPAFIALALKAYGPGYRKCYSWLGPNQPGVNETDPSNPSAAVPDPGGAPPGYTGPATNAAQLTAADVLGQGKKGKSSPKPVAAGKPTPQPTGVATKPVTAGSGSGAGSGAAGAAPKPAPNPVSSVGSVAAGAITSLQKALSGVVSGLLGSGGSGGSQAQSGGSDSSAQQLLQYLLSP